MSSNSSGTTPNVPTDLTEQLPGEIVDYSEQHTEDLKALAHEIAEWPEHVRVGLARSWPDPDVLPYPGDVRDGNAVWTADQMPLIQTLLAAAGAPFTAVNADPVPPRERAFVTAPPRHSDLEPVERPTLELLTDAVRQSGQVERINGWLTEAHQAGVPFSPLAMPNVGNYERLRFALRLAEFAEDDQQLGFAIACPDGQSTMTLGQTIGEMTGADAQAAFNRIEALSTGRSALLYSDDGHPIIVNQVSAP